MSFEWNLSSDEDEGFGGWGNDGLRVAASKASGSIIHKFDETNGSEDFGVDDGSSSSSDEDGGDPGKAASAFVGIAFQNNFESGNAEDDVDWEDAVPTHYAGIIENTELAADNEQGEISELTPSNLRPITLNLNKDEDGKKSKEKPTKKVARKRFRFEQLTPDLQYLLSNLEKAHLLSLTAHALVASRESSTGLRLHTAHSLIPMAWVKAPSSAPTSDDLRSFCSFFFRLVHPHRHQAAHEVVRRPRYNRRGKKRSSNVDAGNTRVAGEAYPLSASQAALYYRTEEFCSFLGERSRLPDPASHTFPRSDFHTHDEVLLFVSMARSLGWRARYITVLEPTKKDLDVDHPLFVVTRTRNVFQELWKKNTRDDGADDNTERPAKRIRMEQSSVSNGPVEGNTDEPIDFISRRMDPSLRKRKLPLAWVELLCQDAQRESGNRSAAKLRWVHLDISNELLDEPESAETALHAWNQGVPISKSKKKQPVPYVLAAEHIVLDGELSKTRLTDVTPRYSSSYVETMKVRGVLRGKQGPIDGEQRVDKWWNSVLNSVNHSNHAHRQILKEKGRSCDDAIDVGNESDDEGDKKPRARQDTDIHNIDDIEEKQLEASKRDEPIPTSKTAFKTNPIFTLPSLLNSNEVLKPDAKKRVCGVFKGELVFRRSDVEVALPASKWLYKGRRVKDSELARPAKRVKARNKGPSKSFKALKSYGVGNSNDGSDKTRDKTIEAASKPLDDGMENLYASWQTDPWSPKPIGPNDPIPANEHNNIELALLNPGLVHIDKVHMAKVAKKLGVPYVPCLLGFEGHGGNRSPTIRGIVVHQHNEDLLLEAHTEMESHLLQEEHENRQRSILLRWKRLMVGVLTKDRLDKAYG